MNFFTKLLTVFFISAMAMPVHAQNPKLGHVNTQSLVQGMPAYKEAQKKLQDYIGQLQVQADKMQDELERLTNSYVADEKTLSNTMKEIRQQEIKDLQRRLEMLQTTSEEDVRDKQNELLKPLEEQVMAAIKAVAIEKGYSYIFDSSAGVVLYLPPADDVTNLVKTKLGIP